MKKKPLPDDSDGNKWQEMKQILLDIYALLVRKTNLDEDFYDNADLKQLLKVSDSTLHRLRKKGMIPFKKIQGKIYHPKSFFNNAFNS